MNSLMKKLIVSSLLLLLALCLLGSACAETDAELWDLYQQPNVRTEGQAYLELVPSVQPVCITDGEMPIWRFSLFMTETNGVPFTADSAFFTRFDEGHNVLSHVAYSGSEFAMSYLPQAYLPGETMGYTVNQPADATTHYGIRISGVDANGSPCSFSILVPLSQDVLPTETPEAFRAPDKGDTLITLTPGADPVYLEPLEFFDGGLGWASSLTVANVSDSPVTLTAMRMVMFTESGDILVQLDYSDAAIALFTGEISNVLAPGQSIELGDLCPYQDMAGYGYRFTAETEDGRTQTANCFFACVKEEAP